MYAVVFYYHDTEATVTATYLQILLRVACGLCTGMMVYYIVRMLQEKRMKDESVVGILLLAIQLLLSVLQMSDRRVALLYEFAGLVLLLAGEGFNNNRLTDFVAKLSMMVYILH